MKKILGISAYYHDSAAAISIGPQLLAAAQEERFSRKKQDAGFPIQAVQYCLEEAGLTIDQLDAVVFYDKPFLKFERLLETYYQFAPKGFISFLKAMPIWLKDKLFLRRLLLKELQQIGTFNKKKLKILFGEHHLSHAASAFYASPFEQAAVMTIDGVGEWCTASIAKGHGSQLEILEEMHFPHSVGLLYSAFTYYLGFKVNSGEYKLMGLAPYGDAHAEETLRFVDLIKNKLCRIHEDGSIQLAMDYFRFATGLTMCNDKRWQDLFGFPRKSPDDLLQKQHCNLALAIQLVTEDIMLLMATHAKKITGSDYLCLAGGVALNCVANAKIAAAGLFKDIYIQPAAGDAGGAVGAVLSAYYLYFKEERIPTDKDLMQGAYLGPSYSDKEIERLNRGMEAVATHYQDFDSLCRVAAALLQEGNVLGCFQGRMEFGPRALGNRSILADARNSEMQKKLNLKIKYRESFRPFAPSVLEEEYLRYFDSPFPSPYMLLTAPLRAEFRNSLPPNYEQLELKEQLYFKRSNWPAITHLDFSARLQTVSKESNPAFHQLLSRFFELTGCPMLVNTSFNVRGEPIVCSPEDAYRCFMATEMDYLLMGNYLYKKEAQPDFENKEKWQRVFEAD